MYAERFQVRSWLETPAKWLAWAIDSASNLKDMAWNLQQFWKTLEPLKTSSLGSQQWSEILLLDSRAQSTLGHYYLIKAAQQAKTASVHSVDSAWARAFSLGVFSAATLLPKVREFLAKNDPGLKGYQASIKQLYDQAQAAFQKAAQMADQSQKAMKGSDATMATRAQTLAKSGQTITRISRGQTEQQINDTASGAGPQLDLPKLITTPFGGIPLWGWLAGIAAVSLVLSTGPTVVAVSRARRMAA